MLMMLAVAASQVYVLVHTITFTPVFDSRPMAQIVTKTFPTSDACASYRAKFAVGPNREVLLDCKSLAFPEPHNVLP